MTSCADLLIEHEQLIGTDGLTSLSGKPLRENESGVTGATVRLVRDASEQVCLRPDVAESWLQLAVTFVVVVVVV